MTLPANLPDIASARLPAAYEHAKHALAECERIDECKTWADKMAALASYARQAEDESLLKHAMRIQGRAVRRGGDLLKEIDARGAHMKKEGSRLSQAGAGEAAGMSSHQVKTAVRVASIPSEQFEQAVESDNPPTVTALAEMGKKPRPVKVIDHTEGRDPKEFALAIHVLGELRRHADSVRGIDPAAVVRGSFAPEHKQAAAHIGELATWLESLKRELETVDGVRTK